MRCFSGRSSRTASITMYARKQDVVEWVSHRQAISWGEGESTVLLLRRQVLSQVARA